MVHYVLNFIRNFTLVFGSISLFFAPFIAAFWWQHRQQIREKTPHFNYFMEKFFTSKQADWLVFTWAAAEALVWFVIPEFLLLLVVFMRVHRKFRLVSYDIAGTVVGTIIGFLWVLPRSSFLHVPYVYPKMLHQVQIWYEQHGIWALWHQPFSGVPYKVFVQGAHAHAFFIPLFIIVAIIARISRYVITYQLTVMLYPVLHKFVRRHYAVLFVFAVLVFTFLLMRVVTLYS